MTPPLSRNGQRIPIPRPGEVGLLVGLWGIVVDYSGVRGHECSIKLGEMSDSPIVRMGDSRVYGPGTDPAKKEAMPPELGSAVQINANVMAYKFAQAPNPCVVLLENTETISIYPQDTMFIYMPKQYGAPVITDFQPREGDFAGGWPLMIIGENFIENETHAITFLGDTTGQRIAVNLAPTTSTLINLTMPFWGFEENITLSVHNSQGSGTSARKLSVYEVIPYSGVPIAPAEIVPDAFTPTSGLRTVENDLTLTFVTKDAGTIQVQLAGASVTMMAIAVHEINNLEYVATLPKWPTSEGITIRASQFGGSWVDFSGSFTFKDPIGSTICPDAVQRYTGAAKSFGDSGVKEFVIVNDHLQE